MITTGLIRQLKLWGYKCSLENRVVREDGTEEIIITGITKFKRLDDWQKAYLEFNLKSLYNITVTRKFMGITLWTVDLKSKNLL